MLNCVGGGAASSELSGRWRGASECAQVESRQGEAMEWEAGSHAEDASTQTVVGHSCVMPSGGGAGEEAPLRVCKGSTGLSPAGCGAQKTSEDERRRAKTSEDERRRAAKTGGSDANLSTWRQSVVHYHNSLWLS